MPELGKATYRVIIDTRQFTAGLARAEGRALAAGRAITASLTKAGAAGSRLGVGSAAAAKNFSKQMRMMQFSAAAASTAASRWSVKTGASLTSLGARGKKVEEAGRKLSRAFLPLAAALGISVKKAIDFEQQMKLIQTQAGGTAKDVRILSRQVLQLAKSTAQGPNELARGLFHLKSLGLSNARAMDVLRQSARGAMTGIADLEKTTSALGGAVRVGIKGTGDYGKAMGTLNGIIGAGNMRMENLIEALGTGILPTAKLAGLSLTDVGAALTVFTDENMDAAMAMTRFRTALMMMVSPSHQAEKSLATIGLSGKRLGLELQKPEGLGKSLKLINQHLREHFDLTTKAGRAGAFGVISRAFGGARSANTIMVLLNQAGLYQQKHAQITRSSKKFDRDVAASSRTAANQIKKAWSNVQVTMVLVGRDIVPIVLKVTKAISKLAIAFAHLPAPVRRAIIMFGLLLTAVGPVVFVYGRLMRATKLLGTAMLILGGRGRGVKGGLGAANTAIIGTGGSAGKAATKVGRLSRGLRYLSLLKFIAITIAIDLLINPKGPTSWLKKNVPGFKWLGDTVDKHVPFLRRLDERKGLLAPGEGGSLLGRPATADEQAAERKGQRALPMTGKVTPAKAKMWEKGLQTFLHHYHMTEADFWNAFMRGYHNQKLKPPISVGEAVAWQRGRDAARLAKAKKGNQAKETIALIKKLSKQGLSIREIAKATHTSVADVRSILHKVTPQLTTDIPLKLQLAVARSHLTKTEADDLKALKAEDRWLRRALHQKGLSLQQRIDITNQIAEVDSAIADLTKDKKKKKKSISGSKLVPYALRLALLRARTTETEKDDLKALKAEDEWLRKALRDKKISKTRREKLLEDLAKVDKEIINLKKKHDKDTKKTQAQAFLEARGSFFADFTPNVFSPSAQGLTPGSESHTVHYNQNNTFHEIPKDRHRLARQMHRSVALVG